MKCEFCNKDEVVDDVTLQKTKIDEGEEVMLCEGCIENLKKTNN
jgi:hypothetical protein